MAQRLVLAPLPLSLSIELNGEPWKSCGYYTVPTVAINSREYTKSRKDCAGARFASDPQGQKALEQRYMQNTDENRNKDLRRASTAVSSIRSPTGLRL